MWHAVGIGFIILGLILDVLILIARLHALRERRHDSGLPLVPPLVYWMAVVSLDERVQHPWLLLLALCMFHCSCQWFVPWLYWTIRIAVHRGR